MHFLISLCHWSLALQALLWFPAACQLKVQIVGAHQSLITSIPSKKGEDYVRGWYFIGHAKSYNLQCRVSGSDRVELDRVETLNY